MDYVSIGWALQGLKNLFCVPKDELLRAKNDLLSEGGQSLNCIFADCFGDWFIGIPFVGDDVVTKCISKLRYVLKNVQN